MLKICLQDKLDHVMCVAGKWFESLQEDLRRQKVLPYNSKQDSNLRVLTVKGRPGVSQLLLSG